MLGGCKILYKMVNLFPNQLKGEYVIFQVRLSMILEDKQSFLCLSL